MNQPKPDTIPLTPSYFDFITQEDKRLVKEREEILVRLQAAREMGDLSENGAYHAAKFELGNTDRELRRIHHLLRYGKITQPVNNGRVGFGTRVLLTNGSKPVEFTFVSSYEADPKLKKLSLDSPLGLAVEGKKPGDECTVKTPDGEVTWNVVKIVE